MTVNRWCAALLAVAMTAGCGGDSGPKTVPVTGVVIYKGQPVAEASVSFLGDGTTRPAVGITDDSGTFILTTSRSGDGAVPGKHAVTVSKTVEPPKKEASGGSISMEEAALAAQKPAEESKTLYLVPEKYSMPDSSGLSVEVKEGEDNHFELKLED